MDDLLTAAARARDAGDAAAERRLLDQARGLAPENPLILNACGMAALRRSDPAAARRWFEAAADRDREQPALWMNIATACRTLQDDAGEQSALEQALAIDRRNFMAQLRLAELHERRGDAIAAAIGWSAVVQLARTVDPQPPIVADAARRGEAFLAAHNGRIDARLDALVGDKVDAMGDAARRFRACVDHSLGRRRIYTNQCEGLHYPFLPADEFFDRAHFPWLPALEARTEAIAAEAIAMLRDAGPLIRPYVRMDAGSPETKWSGLDGSLDWSACFLWEYGVRNDPVCAACPETAAALAAIPQTNIPGKAPSAFFSILRPGAHIPPHTGVTNTRAIIHLPLVVPGGCRFRVGGETREWRVGEAFGFDDTIEHEAWNASDEIRIVLILDVWNPYLTTDEQQLLAAFFEAADTV
ncbi:aspartyl/asparaginyl beta-hydroxylase domain-containing protein [Sphingomonas montanisoli]|uniref:aspartyl/asparaginyl beta-hydroxylase domain-containing protein n=1 Tax=Sphingomonas montanisoli TaxID=2606412 RepID=UPI001FE5361B|nr:aspartyl/asparaginyl beta-hydroxylase domain-containing protein [Sphingomonas montanisoli]